MDVPDAGVDDRPYGADGTPVANELPLVLECELVSMNEENCNVVGKILNCAGE